MPRPRWHDLRVGTWNTHASAALRQGGLGWLMDQAPGVQLWLLQEVRERETLRDALVREQARADWMILPVLRDDEGIDYDTRKGLPYILADRSRFDYVDQEAPDITFGSHYERRALQVRLEDRRSGRQVVASDIHVDPLGRGFEDANAKARRRHERQVAVYVDQVHEAPKGAVVLAGGDGNEDLNDRVRGDLADRTLVARMAAVGARPAFELTEDGDRGVHLDDVFVRTAPFVKVASRRRLAPPQPGNDHPAVVVRFQVQAAA